MPYTFEDVTADKYESECNWKEISQEKYRTYIYLRENSSVHFVIKNPIALDVHESGGHIVVREDGKSFYIKAGWDIIEWDNHEEFSRAKF